MVTKLRQRRMPLPKLPGIPRGTGRQNSTLYFPRASKITQNEFTAYPPPSGKMIGRPITEWVVYDDLTRRRNFREGEDFLYQVALPVAGLLRSRGFTRADFWILPRGKNGSPGGAFSRGIIINPISFFTHPNPSQDRMERAILAASQFLEVFIDEGPLLADPHYMVGLALRGIDVSSRQG